jgi:hypothetical protein
MPIEMIGGGVEEVLLVGVRVFIVFDGEMNRKTNV